MTRGLPDRTAGRAERRGTRPTARTADSEAIGSTFRRGSAAIRRHPSTLDGQLHASTEDEVTHPLENLQPDDIVLDAVPEEVLASMESRDRWMAGLQYPEGGLEFLVADLQSWTPGQTVRVAFLGGSAALHGKIEEAAKPIMDAANLTLDFRAETGFRTWSTQDTDYAAEVRVSFDQGGYFSLLGTDSVNPNIGMPQGTVGGRAHQRSLNLGGFDVTLPAGWDRTTRHEFLHALAFHHEHQNMRGPCESAFRWEDDPGYQPTRDPRGAFIPDSNGRRPGIYTYLSGFPNGWSKAKVDHNLRTSNDNPVVTSGPFDPASVMLYRFPPLFYRTQPSPCSPSGDGLGLSAGDMRGLRLLYPEQAESLQEIGMRREALLSTIEATDEGLESVGGGLSDLSSDAAGRLRTSLEQLPRRDA
jgi:hypothetical protein